MTALLIIAVGWFMFIGPERSSTASLRAHASQTRLQNAQTALKVRMLQIKTTKLAKYRAELEAALSALPADSGLPAFTRELSAQASANQVTIGSVVVGGVSAVTAAVPPASTPTPAPTDSSSTATSTPAAGAPASVAGSLFSVQVTVTSTGTLANQLAFLTDIRTAGPRRALITSTQFAPGASSGAGSIDGSTSFTTQLTIFSAPQTPAQIAQLKKLLTGKIGN